MVCLVIFSRHCGPNCRLPLHGKQRTGANLTAPSCHQSRRQRRCRERRRERSSTRRQRFARSLARKFFRNFSSGRRGRFRQKIVEIGAILAIFEPFEVRKFRMPFFGEFGRSSQDLGESDYNSIKSRDDRLNSPKSGMWIFRRVI